MTTRELLLAAYDDQLRTDAETTGATSVERLGPLYLVRFLGGRGFITYRDLGGSGQGGVRLLVAEALAHYEADPDIDQVEWKTRGHDHAPGLHEALLDHGFEPEQPESIMLGEAASLAVHRPLPEGVTLRKVTSQDDVRATSELAAEVFGDLDVAATAASLLHRLALGDGMEIWVAEAEGQMVSTGRLDPVDGTEFAGIWGGATRSPWRGRGIYRALTAVRAQSAVHRGKRFVHSDSTEGSRPILERSGLLKVSTTTPYVWRRR